MASSKKKKSKKTTLPRKTTTKKPALEYPYILIEPDRPDIWKKAGFGVEKKGRGKKKKEIVFIPKTRTRLHTLYYAQGESEYYSASFFGGEMHVQLIPLFQLADFLEKQISIDIDEGKFYDLITIKENGRAAWGEESGFSNTSESAEELLLYLEQYKRHGALIGEGGSFDYIQICYIQLA